MSDKLSVELRIASASEGHALEQLFTADRYDKDGTVFLRYAETDPNMGRTVTTVKIGADAVRIIRHGDIRSEQTFRQAERLRGYYETQHGKLELEMETKTLDIRLGDTPATVRWGFDLYVSGQSAGFTELALTIGKE